LAPGKAFAVAVVDRDGLAAKRLRQLLGIGGGQPAQRCDRLRHLEHLAFDEARGLDLALEIFGGDFGPCRDRARGLAFAAFGAAGFCRRRPAVDIDMQPACRGLHEALQEQRAGERAGKAAGRRIGDVGDLGIQPCIVSRPQRHAPQRIMLLAGQPRNVGRQ
ncbi:hypothetical protein KXV85_005077, partial [Aspergillus fumigatus]